MKVHFYGKLTGIFGAEAKVSVEPPCTVATLRAQLIAEYPEAADWLGDRRVRVAVGDVFVSDSNQIERNDRIEFLSPLSGG